MQLGNILEPNAASREDLLGLMKVAAPPEASVHSRISFLFMAFFFFFTLQKYERWFLVSIFQMWK